MPPSGARSKFSGRRSGFSGTGQPRSPVCGRSLLFPWTGAAARCEQAADKGGPGRLRSDSPAMGAGERKGVAVMGAIAGARRWSAGPVRGACWTDGSCRTGGPPGGATGRAGAGSPLGWALGLPLRNALACRMPTRTLFPQVSTVFRKCCRSSQPSSPPCYDRPRGDHRVPGSSRDPSQPRGPLGPGRAWPPARWSDGWQMRAVHEAGRLS